MNKQPISTELPTKRNIVLNILFHQQLSAPKVGQIGRRKCTTEIFDNNKLPFVFSPTGVNVKSIRKPIFL